jgi:hypothetical protein
MGQTKAWSIPPAQLTWSTANPLSRLQLRDTMRTGTPAAWDNLAGDGTFGLGLLSDSIGED